MRPRSRHPYRSLSDDWEAPRTPTRRALAPLLVRFVNQTDTEYTVGELGGQRTAVVPKRRAGADLFPPTSHQHARGRRLLRWSLYALVGAGGGGIIGIVLGSAVVIAALVRLAHFSSKVRRWRRNQRTRREQSQLPATATAERFYLLAALGQGVVAVAAGVLVLLLLAGFL